MDNVDGAFLSRRVVAVNNPLLDQLPSYQTLLYRRKSSGSSSTKRRRVSRGRYGSTSSGGGTQDVRGKCAYGRTQDGPSRSTTEHRLARELPLNMAEKRRHKLQLYRDLSGWKQWRSSAGHYLKRMREEGSVVFSSMQLWRTDIHLIEGMFGTGILSYFSFLRFLVLLNFMMFLLIFSFVILPVIVAKRTSSNLTVTSGEEIECSVYPPRSRQGLVVFHQYITDLLSGTGFLEQTYLFYGSYMVESIQFPSFSYSVPIAYLLCTIAYLLLSLLWIVKRSVTGFKRKLIRDEDRFQSFCNKIFAAWDCCITNENAARLKHKSLLYELKTDLEEERIRQKIAERSRQEKCRIYTLRFTLNLFVICVLAACFYAIYIATIFSQQIQAQASQQYTFIVALIFEYLPSIVITMANFITPIIFTIIISFEDYSPAFEIRFTLLRCVFMRLASIGVLLFSLWSQIRCPETDCPCGYNKKLYPCWETHVGQEMYKLLIFDFLIIGAVTLFVEFPRKILVNHCDYALVKWLGQQEFAIPHNVLEIIYGQTICWIGAFYCPLLPAINTIKYYLVFYIKKVTLVNNCRPASRPFRASSSTFFFLAVLLIGLVLATVPIIVSMTQIRSSGSCGPFVNYNTSWAVVPQTVSLLHPHLRSFLTTLSSEAFAVSFFVITCMAMLYVIALAGAYKRVINQLRDQLVMEGRDKRFLIQKLCQAQANSSSRLVQGYHGNRRHGSTGVYMVQVPT
ncbi:transmembrane channel-like protein 7 isoform X1 [Electrophorus electricus]|uniref:transmembrane channel-like protein 7 isoform X1 n=2 Tax=Electrophorus electricus TaxID=8005 RepID=UPI0015D05550|nr:transmembrane channel-like protein 7 isoform X1 [Electrophorus electricus]